MMAAHDQPTLQYRPPVAKSGSAGGTLLTQSKIMQALKDATLGDYEILAEIGRGGMATVFLANDISLDRKVAIKVMSPALIDGESAIERFKREAKTAAALSHPHIIPIHTVRQSGELLYFVMKYVAGRPLDDVIRTKGGLPIPMVVQILVEVASALAYAHRKGVVHRDVKPANVLLDDDGWAIVTDFGIAKVVEKDGLTLTGSTVGTPAYMSPEQCAAGEVTGQSDQYSLGIVGYELLTGRVPFNADSLMRMFLAQTNEAPAPIRAVRPDCPQLLVETIERMMSKRSADRWPSLEAAIDALEPLKETTARESTRVSMATLARDDSGRPRPDDFTRPQSPTPLNSPRQSASVQQRPTQAHPPLPVWIWVVAAMPVIALITWLAMQSRPPVAPTSVPPSDSMAVTSPTDSTASAPPIRSP